MKALLVTAIILLFLNLVFLVIAIILLDDWLEQRKAVVATGSSDQHTDPCEGCNTVADGVSVAKAANPAQLAEVPQEIYDKSVGRFIDLMHRIVALKKHAAVQRLAFRYLAGIDSDKESLLHTVKRDVADTDFRVMFTTLAHDIDAFMTNERPNIDGYLHVNAAEGVDSYLEAVSMPEGAPFDASLHVDLLDEAAPGDVIARVLALGYRFPHSTIAPYRVKPQVMV